MILPIRNTSLVHAQNSYYNEPYRPQYHFSQEANWMNDPNGMVYYEGEYHLFYQYHPNSTHWGPMNWGHAVSRDLVHWEHLPIALKPDENGYVFSGSAVVDWNNTSGLGTDPQNPPLIAIFTHAKDKQVQSLAYSNDKGRTWEMYKGNPIMANTPSADWRDPKVFWYDGTKTWVMILAAGQKAMLYTSPNLKEWNYVSEFGKPNGAADGVWECPDLFALPVDGDSNRKKWVLTVSINNGAVAGGSGMQYFVGDFDGTKFTNDNPASSVLWADYGADFYAGVTWSDAPNNNDNRLWLGWMSNWQYANDTPTSTWRSAYSTVRKLELKTLPEGIRLVQKPVSQLEQLRKSVKSVYNQEILPGNKTLTDVSGDTLEIVAEFQVNSNTTADEFGFKVRKGEHEQTIVGYNRKKSSLFVDRSQSGSSNFNDQFAKVHAAPLTVQNQKVKMHIFVDRSSAEVFGNDGEKVITDQIFPDASSVGVELYAANGKVSLDSLQIYSLDKVWKKDPFQSNLANWAAASGSWVDTIDGKQGRGMEASNVMASDNGTDFTYQADIKLSESSTGTGGLVFHSNEDGSRGYVASLDAASNVVRLYNSSDHATIASYRTRIEPKKSYNMKVVTSGSTIKVYINEILVISTSDTAYKSGRFGLLVQNDTFLFQNVTFSSIPSTASRLETLPVRADSTPYLTRINSQGEITNPDFETGDLTGWTVVSGDIFSDRDVTADRNFWGGPFQFSGNYHLWGHKAGTDGRTGVLKSENFILSGNGMINFLIGGGNQIEKQYVALVRASDGVEIFKETGKDTESYRRIIWNASQYLGQEVYIKVVDNNTDGFGHLNIDDFRVKNF
nr:glycoside hydrolase family 32 protein [Paenibacillus phytorum]